LIAYLKDHSDKVIGATQGNGTTSHLTSELFQMMAGVKLRHIPYRGSAPALQGLSRRRRRRDVRQSRRLAAAGSGRQAETARGRLAQPLAALPDVPTIAETLPGFQAVAWYGIVAPPKTPKGITDKINAMSTRRCVSRGAGSPAEIVRRGFRRSVDKTSAYLREEIDRWDA